MPRVLSDQYCVFYNSSNVTFTSLEPSCFGPVVDNITLSFIDFPNQCVPNGNIVNGGFESNPCTDAVFCRYPAPDPNRLYPWNVVQNDVDISHNVTTTGSFLSGNSLFRFIMTVTRGGIMEFGLKWVYSRNCHTGTQFGIAVFLI